MKIKVVVLGKNYSAPLGVLRSLGQASHSIDVIYITNHQGDSNIIASSKYVSRTFEVVGRNDEDILNLLLTEFIDKAIQYILFPTDDLYFISNRSK